MDNPRNLQRLWRLFAGIQEPARSRKRATVIAATVLSLSVLVGLQAQAKTLVAETNATIDTTKPGPIIDRHIFGQFAEHLGAGIYGGIWVGPNSSIPNTNGIRNDVVAALRAIKVPDVRWPGGCFADKYHWENGVGPESKRPVTLNPDWGGVEEPNTFGTDEFMEFIHQIGSEAYVSVNVGSGTVKEEADWLEYMTSAKHTRLADMRRANGHEAPYKVAMLGIGNESWGCGGSMSPEHFVEAMKQFATFAFNYNPEQSGANHMLKIVSGPNQDDYAWTEAVMKAWKGHIYSWDMDGMSLHSYSATETWPPSHPATGFDETEYVKVLKNSLNMETYISRHSAIMDKYDPDKKIALVVDEWGAWYPVEAGTNPGFLLQQNSQRDAILAALNINIFARHADRVRGANIAQMINVLQAMILTQGDKMVLTPTYYVFKMYVPFQDSVFIPVNYDPGTYEHDGVTLPRADIIAARGKDGKYYLSITNVDPSTPLRVDTSALGFSVKSASGSTLVAPKIDSVNTFATPNLVAPKPYSTEAHNGHLVLEVAPESVTVVTFN